MADTRHRTTWGTRFRFLVRTLGMTGVLAAVVGAVLFASAFPAPSQWTAGTLHGAGEGAHGEFARTAAWTLATGVVAVAIALVVEVVGGLVLVTGRRTAANTSAVVGTAAAAALLVFVNAYSFTHHTRRDFTRDRQFTLPAEVADRLRTLRPESPTTIVVLQNHNLFGSLSTRRDAFTKAAEEKVTEKVKDLVDLFRELGPRFNVVVLDTEAYGYKKQVAEVTKDAPELKAAIDAAPEDSIFFHANKQVQRLAFNEFLQLDKTASETPEGRDNLVLLPQGVETFARRVLAVRERRPKVAVCVVHELLTSAYPEVLQEFTLAGLKASLTSHGFDVVDVVLRKNWPAFQNSGDIEDLKPAADTRQESTLERLEGALATTADDAAAASEQAQQFGEIRKRLDAVKGKPWAERSALYQKLIRGGTVTEEIEPELLASLNRQFDRAEQRLVDARKAQAVAEAKLKEAMRDERAVEARRIADAKAKFARVLADVDLLVVPRITVEDATVGPRIGASIHGLSKEQGEVVRDFMAAGKPVLACLGPISSRTGPARDAADPFERLLTERGIELGRDMVLFDGESAAFAARRAGEQFGGGAPTDIPPLVLEATPDGTPTLKLKPNPVAAATRLTARSVDQKLDLKVRALRPVYLSPGVPARPTFAAEFVTTSPDTWNEERPFPQIRPLPNGTFGVTDVPRYNPTPLDDPKKGTREEERRGPFPVGVAIDGPPPAHWSDDRLAPAKVAALLAGGPDLGDLVAGLAANAQSNTPKGKPSRLIVFGSGNIFSGPKLEPAQEKLLLHTANWLTGREDRLPRADLPAWRFPRVEMTEREVSLWRYGTAIGLPLLAVYVGLMATMLRRLR